MQPERSRNTCHSALAAIGIGAAFVLAGGVVTADALAPAQATATPHVPHPREGPTDAPPHPTPTPAHGPTATDPHSGHPTRTLAPTLDHPPHPTPTPSHPSEVPVGTVYERSLAFPAADVGNPWSDARLTASLRAPSGAETTIGGFYFGGDEWRLRFAPGEAGRWTWTAELAEAGRAVRAAGADATLATWSGEFSAVPSGERGFLRIGPAEPARLVFGDGDAFPALGIGDCVLDSDGSGTPHDNNWGLDGDFRPQGHDGPGARSTDLGTYARAYGQDGAGFNLFRWSVDNCSFKLWETIRPAGNRYLEREGRWGDELVAEMRANGVLIYMAIFGFQPPYAEGGTEPQMAAVRDYVDYVVARYGAQVDVWELMNEANASDAWITAVAGYLREADPYDHPISTSWERPDHPAIELVSPHWYEREDELASDSRTAEQVRTRLRPGKPVIFGEQGNSVQNWDERSAIRMRLRSWSAFFNGGALVFWNSSYAKDNKGGAANLYIGPEERGFVRVLQAFAGAVGPAAAPFAPTARATGGAVRAYGLREPGATYAYLVHADDHERAVLATVDVDLDAPGHATWTDPATGQAVGHEFLPPGLSRLTSPPFGIDLALEVRTGRAAERPRVFLPWSSPGR